MRTRHQLKKIAQQLTGFWFWKRSHLPRGTDLCWDIQRTWGAGRIRTLLDIGANVGQFCLPFSENFPEAVIHCFEPVFATFARLQAAVRTNPMVRCHHMAVGSQEGKSRIFVNPDITESSLVACYGTFHEEAITVATVDYFCQQHGILQIDLMKVDVEGFEIEVLKGASRMLAEHKIGLLLLETELVPTGKHFIPLAEFHRWLHPFGYEIFGIYHQHHHWDGRRSLSIVNVLFAAKELVSPIATP